MTTHFCEIDAGVRDVAWRLTLGSQNIKCEETCVFIETGSDDDVLYCLRIRNLWNEASICKAASQT